MSQVKIADRLIVRSGEPFIIAEVGINHNGEIDNALKMISIAKESGADAVKFQTFKADEFVGDPDLTYTYMSQGREVTESMLEMFKRYEFTREQWFILKRQCEKEEILFLSTPQNQSDMELLIEVGVAAVKVGSDDFTNLPLLKKYAQSQLPLILSCGMADLAEVHYAFDAVGSLNGYPTILLLCTSQYPTPPEDVNLRKINTLSCAFPMVPIGFSDHTQGSLAASLAVGLGAVVFEKHFTLSHDLPGPDHWFSENPRGLAEWVKSIRTAYRMMGSAIVRPTLSELNMRTLARRSITALENIVAGEDLTEANIGLRRPGTGLSPRVFEQMVGLTAARDIKRGKMLDWGDVR